MSSLAFSLCTHRFTVNAGFIPALVPLLDRFVICSPGRQAPGSAVSLSNDDWKSRASKCQQRAVRKGIL